MSQVSRDKLPAPSTPASPPPSRRPPRPARLVSLAWLPAIVALVVATIGFGFAAASCGQGTDNYAGLDGGEGVGGHSPGCIGPTCPAACAANPGPGCPCSVEGQHKTCGKVEGSYPAEGQSPAQTVCGMGYSVCTGGVWSDCAISGATIVVPGAPPGYYAEGLGTQGPCANNPCDPSCQDFPDTPSGLDAGSSLLVTDAGITLAGGGTPPCVPQTCQSLGYNCGVQSDGCGHALQCGSCTFPQVCGGGGVSKCGTGVACTGLCLKQVTCANNGTTSISGVTYMPNGVTPLPNVLVYVPNGPVSDFVNNSAANAPICVSANNCNAEVSGTPLVATTSADDGTFKLTNVPAGVSFPVVMQLGRFRRQFTMTPVTACTNSAITCTASNTGACLTRFPRKQHEYTVVDNIPKMAFSTGKVDALECVWIKVGIDYTSNLYGSFTTGEFTPGNTQGRINLYYGGTQGGAYIGAYGTGAGQTPQFETSVLDNPTTVMNQYDMILFPCQGKQDVWSNQIARETAVADYANAGGRVFNTHFSYIWIYSDNADLGLACTPNGAPCSGNSSCCSLTCTNNVCQSAYSSPLSSALVWSINQSQSYGNTASANANINMSFTAGATLGNWLFDIGQSTTLGQMSINTIRHNFNGVIPPAQMYVSLPAAASTDLNMDPANCGSCGNVCSGTTPLCSAGACVAACPSGTTQCSGQWCANLESDPYNCGACGNECGSGTSCVGGVCGGCPFSQTDPNNCGACGTVCGAGAICSGGNCQCPSGLSWCNGACTSELTDPNNCGGCGVVCPGGSTCSNGSCSACPTGMSPCGSTCVNTKTDRNNCGACGTVCTGGACNNGTCAALPGYTLACATNSWYEPNASVTHCGTTCGAGACSGSKKCKAGSCTTNSCATGTTNCNRACVNLNTDAGNCGACGNVCPYGTTCSSGSCTGCAAGTTPCGGQCVNTTTDPNNCGGCGNACPGGSTCSGSACVAPTGQTICSNSITTNLKTDPSNCGSCGHTCSYWLGCNNGTCSCPGGYTSCSSQGICADLTSDASNCGSCGHACTNGKVCQGSVCVNNQVASNSQTCAIPQQASFNSGPLGLATPAANQCGRVVYSDFHVENATNTDVAFPGECSLPSDGGLSAFSPQEAMLAQALFDLAGCVNVNNTVQCTPTNCASLGVGCGTTGDGCGNTLDCGTCVAPATCGGGGVLNQCGVMQTFTGTQFVRQYTASCANNQHPIWRGYWWTAITPLDSSISFQIATASTLAGLSTATLVPLQWSAAAPADGGSPPGLPGVPQGYTIGQPAIAQQGSSSPLIANTDIWGASPDATFYANSLPQNNNYVEVVATLTPSAGGVQAPTLSSWDMQIDCVDNE